MYVSTITVICYYNGQILRIGTYVKYEGKKARIVPLEVLVECTFEQLTDMIYTRTTIDKQRFKLVLNCKYPLKSGNRFQHFPKVEIGSNLYSIKAHQEFVVVASSKKLLVLRCKILEECHCPWKLRAMVVKDTYLFVINKYIGSRTCVNPCLNRDHHQLDSNLVAAHIKAIIMAQFTLTTTAIQASVMEK